MKEKSFIVFVQYENYIPLVASSEPRLDSDFNLYVDLSDNLKEAHITSDLNYLKAVKKSFSGMPGYKVTKMYI